MTYSPVSLETGRNDTIPAESLAFRNLELIDEHYPRKQGLTSLFCTWQFLYDEEKIHREGS
jgi:hypothetical protein